MELRGSHALITGGSAGIGLALARALLERGGHPVVIGRSRARLEATINSTAGLDGFVCDVTDPGASSRIRDWFVARGVPFSLLFNNAGVQYACGPGDAAWAAPGGLSAEIELNIQALTRLTYELLPDLSQDRPTALINISSGLALAPKRSSPIYCATKAYVRSFTRSVRYRVQDAGLNIHVMEALPPLVDTDMTRGRGEGGMSADRVASEIIKDLIAGRHDSRVGKVKLLAVINRVSPALAYRIAREW